jgi:hypothetical protein
LRPSFALFDIEHTANKQTCYNVFVLKNRERWLELAELAANEQDPKKLMELVNEINQLLAEKQARLDRLTPNPSEET